MKKLLIIFLILVSLGFSYAQKRKKVPKVRAEVTVKGNFPPLREKPNEEDAGIWNEYKSAEFGFEVVFPAKNEDVFDDEFNDVKFFQSSTRKANYGVIVKPVPKAVSQNGLKNLFENVFELILGADRTKIISQTNVRLGDLLGKEIIYERESSRVFSRFFIDGNKLYIISMIMDKKDYKQSFDEWALKFLDSFNLPVKIKNEG